MEQQKQESELKTNRLASSYFLLVDSNSKDMPYYLSALGESERKSFCRFKIGLARLHSFNSNVIARCGHCENNILADEYHFILVCPAFAYSRAEFLPPNYKVNPTLYKFKQLMNTKNLIELKNLAKFISFIISNIN